MVERYGTGSPTRRRFTGAGSPWVPGGRAVMSSDAITSGGSRPSRPAPAWQRSVGIMTAGERRREPAIEPVP